MEKEKEFKLSEKVISSFYISTPEDTKIVKNVILRSDVKEFIKLLKEEAWIINLLNFKEALKSDVSEEVRNEIIDLVEGCMYEMCNRIDKLTGGL